MATEPHTKCPLEAEPSAGSAAGSAGATAHTEQADSERPCGAGLRLRAGKGWHGWAAQRLVLGVGRPQSAGLRHE